MWKINDLKKQIRSMQTEINCIIDDLDDAIYSDTSEDFIENILCIKACTERLCNKIKNFRESIRFVTEDDFKEVVNV